MIGANLKYLRLKNGFSQEYVANYLGRKSFTTVQKWESDVSDPPLAIVGKLAELYKVSIDDLFYQDLTNSEIVHQNLNLSDKEETMIKKYRSLYDRIRKLRIEKNLSQDELAKMMGYVSRSTINKIESGLVDISCKKLIGFSKALNTTPQYLLDGDRPIVKEAYSDREKEIIRKYRALPASGKAAVNAVLDSQYEFVKPKVKKGSEIS